MTFMPRIEKLYEKEKNKLEKELNECDFVAVTADGYTQKFTGKHFDTITAQYLPKGSDVMKSKVLELAEFKGERGGGIRPDERIYGRIRPR
jgi:hypothetical protein